MIESLKKLDITALDDKDREKLRFLSLQYQFHLQQYEEQHKAAAYAIQPIHVKQPESSNQPSIMSLKLSEQEKKGSET